jgi:hypothetical protein
MATLFYAPLSLAGPVPMMLILLALSSLGYFMSIFISVYLATGKWTRQDWPLYLLPGLFCIPFAYDIYYLGQLNMTLLAVMLLGCFALEKKRPGFAGVLFAISAGAKAFPFTIILYLLWRRFYVAAASMLVTLTLILVVLPAPFRGFDRNWQELSTWTDQMLLHNNGATLANQADRGYKFGNQTLLSVVNRLMRPLPVGQVQDGNLMVNLVNVSSRTAFATAIAIALALCAAFAVAMPPRRFLTRRILAFEFSIVLLFIVIFSPKAGSYYYCWTLPGFTLVIAELIAAPLSSVRRRWLTIGLSSCLFVFALALSQAFTRIPQGMGVTMWGGVLLSIILMVLLLEEKKKLRPSLPSSDLPRPSF